MTNEQVFDVTIIGAGPVGLFTAFYAGMRQMSVQIFDSLPDIGGQLTALYPEKFIYDVAGFPKIQAKDLVSNLEEQMKQFNPSVHLNETVEHVEKQSDGTFAITTNRGNYFTKSIIITAGNGAFQPRKLPIEGSEKFENGNLHYYIKDSNQFKGKKVVIFGGGDSAVDWATMLEPIAEQVTLVHRRTEFRAHESSLENLRKTNVNILTPYVPENVIGDKNIEKVVLKNVSSAEEIVLDVDEVIVNFGFVSNLGPIKDWGLSIEKNSIVVNSKMETNIPGIFACGDVCTYDGKVKLIATGFGEAPIAVSSAKMYVDPNAKRHAVHSTTLMEKKK